VFADNLACTECDDAYPTDEIRYRCDCGGSLDVTYDYSQLQDRVNWSTLKHRHFDHHRYQEFYPVINNDHLISLGEGGTPLLEAPTLGDELGLDNLYLKIEGMNPTGSFKDRGTAVEIGKALDFGAEEIVVASTGNMGSSIAAYCARAGIPVNIFVPANVSGNKLKQMKAYGATIHNVDGDYSKAAEKAYEAYKDNGWYLMGDYAYRGEGEKSVGFEIADQITADHVILPVGNGTLMHGTYKGFKEMQRIDLIENVPEIVGIQAAGCSTVAKAFKKGLDDVPTEDNVDTVAGAIACGEPLDGHPALNAIRESGGFADDVTDNQLLTAKAQMAEQEGIYAEESCGTTLAGLKANIDRFDPEDVIVCVVTGHGLKT
jgi:threonine synthase